MAKTYEIEPRGKKFATICREDGYWAMTMLSKNTKLARRKGDEFVSGERTATRRYTTTYGRALNEERSRSPRRSEVEIIVATIAAFHRKPEGEV